MATGKTHLATGLVIATANHAHRVRFSTATQFVTRLTDAHRTSQRPTELARLRRYELIIIDEASYLPFGQDAANLFFQVLLRGSMATKDSRSSRVDRNDDRKP